MSVPEGRAHVGLGRPGPPRRLPAPGDKPHGPSVVASILTSPIVRTLSDTGDPADIPDHQKAERARRLLEAAQGKAPADIWTDVLEIIVEQFQEALEGVMDKRLHPDVLIVYRDLLGTLDEKVVLGATAMQRLIHKRMVLSEAAEQANRTTASSTTGGAT